MGRITGWNVALFILAVPFFCLASSVLFGGTWGPITRQATGEQRIYAYRGWQNTSYVVKPGDIINISAQGEWMYSPQAGPHGPEGHPIFTSPSFYPLPGVRGGALIGKIGEYGAPFYVGRNYRNAGWQTGYLRDEQQESGRLYLRIDDDLLGDNKGYVTARIEAIAPQAE